MNILFLTREYKHNDLPACGGTGNFIATISTKLAETNHNIYVFGVNKSKIKINHKNVNITFIKSLYNRHLLINFLRSITGKIIFLEKLHFYIHELERKDIAEQLYKHIKDNDLKIDIIETHDFEGISLFLDESVPYVIRCHGSWSLLEKYFGYKVEKGRVYCEKKAFKKAKNSIAISEFSKKANHKLFGINKFELIYNGIDTNIFKFPKEIKVIEKSIFYFGNISNEKGADIAIQVFITLLKTEPNATMHFLGKEGNYTKDLTKIIRANNIEEKVYFYGIQSTEKVVEILSKANVVIFPSKGETFGLALCEAMSLSKTVITSNIESFREIIENKKNGFIATNINDYVTSIRYVFENKEQLETIGLQARQTIIQKFSLEKMVQNSLNYYTKVIEDFKS
jgi:glycosyltransferase involved in cell wall biosynthesis